MARFTVYMPDELFQRATAELDPSISWSSILAEGVRERLACGEHDFRCRRCGAAPGEGTDPGTHHGADPGTHPPDGG